MEASFQFNNLDEFTSLEIPLIPSPDGSSIDEQLYSFPSSSSSQSVAWSSLSNENADGSLTNSFCQNLDPNNLFLDLFSLPNSGFPSDSGSPTDFTPDLFLDGSNNNNLMIDQTNWLSMPKQPFDFNDVSLFAIDPSGSNVTGHFPPDPRFEFGNLECISSDPQSNIPFMVENDPYSFLQSNWLPNNDTSSSFDPSSSSSKRVINLKVLDHQVNELFSTQNQQQAQTGDLSLDQSCHSSESSSPVSISSSVSTTASASPLSTPPPLSHSSSESTRPAPYPINIRPKPSHTPILPHRSSTLQPLSQSKLSNSNNGSSSKSSSNAPAGGKSLKPRNKRHTHPEIRKHPNPSDISRPYQCEIPGCGKNFLNKNGLRYHYQEGTCDNAPLNEEDKFKPRYPCLVPGCTRVFKSANGLSYHKSHIHFPHLLSGSGKDINLSKLKGKDGLMSPNLPQTFNSLKRKGILGGRMEGHCNRDTSMSASASGTTTIKSQHLDSIMANLAKRPLFSRHLSHLGTSSLRFASTSLGNFNFGKPSTNANSNNTTTTTSNTAANPSKMPSTKLPRLLPKPEPLDVVA